MSLESSNKALATICAGRDGRRRIGHLGLWTALLGGGLLAACGNELRDGHVDAAPEREIQLGDLEVVRADHAGVPTFANGALGRINVLPGSPTIAEEDAALRPTLASLRSVLRVEPSELVLERAVNDNIGDRHYVYRQRKNGLEVIGASLVLHTRAGAVYSVHGKARTDVDAPVAVALDAGKAIAAVAADTALLADRVIAPDPEMAYDLLDGKLALVYRVQVKGQQRDGLPVDDEVLVSAVDGTIVARIPHIQTAKTRKLYNANHTFTLPGTLVRSEGGAPVADNTVNTNYNLLGITYDCYKTLFNRDSLNDAGYILTSSVHVGTNYVNAYWDGVQLAFGDGNGTQSASLAIALDIAAHEMTHGVTQFTSNLIYDGESGGLNEAMSDIFGAVCSWYRDGNIVTGNTWKMGEEVWTPATPNDALRYMNDPKLDGGSLDYYPDYAPGVDVHYSSGIANLAFYLLTQGGTHPRGRTANFVNGVGLAKAAQIFYRANTVTLLGNPGATFLDAKVATEQAAAQLGYSTADIQSVSNAWLAVGVGLATPACGHDRCASGAALDPACNWCTEAVCDVDPTCCTGTWDLLCAAKVETACNSLRCPVAAPACGHTQCTPGGALTAGCDSCATSICAVDSYCCTVFWDNICVAEVGSICGKNCEG